MAVTVECRLCVVFIDCIPQEIDVGVVNKSIGIACSILVGLEERLYCIIDV